MHGNKLEMMTWSNVNKAFQVQDQGQTQVSE